MTRAGSNPTVPTGPAARADQPKQDGTASADALKPERLIPLLLSVGLVSPAQALRDGISLRQVGRSHVVWRLEIGGAPRAAIKVFGPSRGQTDGAAAREAAAQALAAEVPALAALLPEPLLHSGPPWLVATRWVDGRPAWEQDSLAGDGSGTPAEDIIGLSARVAPGLAAMHRATARLRASRPDGLGAALEGAIPWVLTIFDADAPPELWSHTLLAPMLADAGARPRLVAGIRRARGAWRAIALIHGDLKHDNLILSDSGGVRLVDWEMARAGDPAWDLAGLMFRPLLDPAPERQGWTGDNQAAARALLRAYAGNSGLALEPLAQRLLLYCGAWLLMSLIQYRANASDADADGVRRLLEAAEASVAATDGLVQSLAAAGGAA